MGYLWQNHRAAVVRCVIEVLLDPAVYLKGILGAVVLLLPLQIVFDELAPAVYVGGLVAGLALVLRAEIVRELTYLTEDLRMELRTAPPESGQPVDNPS